MTLTIKIEMDNAAFEPCNGDEAARILDEVADKLRENDIHKRITLPLMDVNGNKVGSAVTGRAS